MDNINTFGYLREVFRHYRLISKREYINGRFETFLLVRYRVGLSGPVTQEISGLYFGKVFLPKPNKGLKLNHTSFLNPPYGQIYVSLKDAEYLRENNQDIYFKTLMTIGTQLSAILVYPLQAR